MIEIIKVILLGIIEGFTEWLPISSTGHMIILNDLIKLNVSADFKTMFFVVIQLGAILAVALMYFNKLNPFSKRKKFQIFFCVGFVWRQISACGRRNACQKNARQKFFGATFECQK